MRGERRRPHSRDPGAMGVGDGETSQTWERREWPSGRRDYGHLQKPSPEGEHRGRVRGEQKEGEAVRMSQTLRVIDNGRKP